MKDKKHFKTASIIMLLFIILVLAGCTAKAAEPDYTKEEIAEIAQEKLEEYLEMRNTCFALSLVAEGAYTQDDFVTINDNGGYLPVSRFASVKEAKDYVTDICTKEFAEELYNQYWDLDGERPMLAEQDGKLYAQMYDGPAYPSNGEILLAELTRDGEILLVYRYEMGEEPKNEMLLRFVEQDGEWYVSEQENW